MQTNSEEERQPLKQNNQPATSFDPKDPPALTHQIRRPWKGIFLTYFLFFCGLLFFAHGIHRYPEYTKWDLMAIWLLSLLLLIPGAYFGIIILAVQLRVGGFSYRDHKQLFD